MKCYKCGKGIDDEVEEMEKETLPRLDEKKLAAIVDSLVKGDASEHD